ncbi:MAG: anaerobic sulfatase maturase [Oscillospiraceae bacterium]|nr:anaerobic sulfatase maturase [Oscillospiraceae bacterium]
MKHLNLLIKPASSLCNLRCRYCFYEDEAQNRSQASMGVMTQETADALICQAFEAVGPKGTLSIAFQGGEPTVAGLDFFRRFVTKAEVLCPAGVQLQFAMQTNGTLLDEDWARFLKQHRFLVGLSLDGVRSLHDMHRVDAAGNGSWKQVLAARDLLEQHGADYNALCVVTGPCAQRAEQVYRNLKRLGFRYLQFIACLDPIGHAHGCEPWSLSPQAYGDFLCRVFDLWFEDWQNGDYHSVRLFDDYIHILLGDGGSTCATCGRCGSYLVVEGDGSVYPCDFYVLDDWKLGDLHTTPLKTLAEGEKAAEFLRWGSKKPAECAACPYSKICNGGCKNDWFTDDTGPHNYYCPAFKKFLAHAMPRLAAIARAEARARGMAR